MFYSTRDQAENFGLGIKEGETRRVSRFLDNRGADVDSATISVRASADTTTQGIMIRCVQLLLDHGADVKRPLDPAIEC